MRASGTNLAARAYVLEELKNAGKTFFELHMAWAKTGLQGKDPYREIDGALQALRRQDRITFTRSGNTTTWMLKD
jgi:hypothetical protein